jgi:NitT/TauT family transport system substrate-binding protein
MEQELLTKRELMEYLRISKGTLDKLMKRRDLPFLKLGKRVLFRRQEIDAWLEKYRVK